MAEALFNHLGQQEYVAVSAGSHPTGYVHPLSLATLKRHGIESENLHSKSWDVFAGQKFDLVITVCDAASGRKLSGISGRSAETALGVSLTPQKQKGQRATFRPPLTMPL